MAISGNHITGYFCTECKVDVAKNNHLPGCPSLPEKAAGGEKLSNPKDIIGSDKVPMSLVPATTKAYLAIGHMEGMLKYGLVNWREAGVRVSIYLDALDRHMSKWQNGEWCDPETKVPHLANAIACLSIIIDAYECGKLTDDRPKQAPVGRVLTELSDTVKHLKKIYGHHKPKHYIYEPKGPSNPDMYDGVAEIREDNNRKEAQPEVFRSHRPEGRHSISSTRSEVPEPSGAIREGDFGLYDTKSVPERSSSSDLRRNKLQPSSERLSSKPQLENFVLRGDYLGRDVPTTSDSN